MKIKSLRSTALSVAIMLFPVGPALAEAESEDSGGAGGSALKRAKNTKKGELKNPYTDNEKAIAEGKELYFSYSCNGCHGGTGGGGMCPPLSNAVWIYGSDDDTVFRLIALGTDGLVKQGYSRIRTEKVKGPMPPFGGMLENEDELWKIIAWMRTTFRGDPKRRNW